MSYVGNPITIGNLTSQLLNGGSSSYTLNYSVGSNASISVFIDGVHQKPGTSYTVSATTLTFPGGATPSGTNNICVVFHSLPISLPTPGDGTVSGTKIAMGSDAQGDVLYYNGSQYTRLAKGTAGQALVMNSGATAPEWASAGGPSLGTDAIIRTNAKTIAENITFAGTENGMSAGPITINSGYTVTVTSGSTWTVVGA